MPYGATNCLPRRQVSSLDQTFLPLGNWDCVGGECSEDTMKRSVTYTHGKGTSEVIQNDIRAGVSCVIHCGMLCFNSRRKENEASAKRRSPQEKPSSGQDCALRLRCRSGRLCPEFDSRNRRERIDIFARCDRAVRAVGWSRKMRRWSGSLVVVGMEFVGSKIKLLISWSCSGWPFILQA